MRKPMITLATLFIAATATGCHAPTAAIAPPATLPVVQADATFPALKTLTPEGTRRLMAAGQTAGTMWGFTFYRAFKEKTVVSFGRNGPQDASVYQKMAVIRECSASQWKMDRYRRDNIGRIIYDSNGRPVYNYQDDCKSKSRNYYGVAEGGWKAEESFAGEGEMKYMGEARYTYRVPNGRVLVINRLEMPARISINGFKLTLDATESAFVKDDVNYVFGAGEVITFSFLHNNLATRPALLSGVVADPAILGGSLPPGMSGEDEAK